MARIPPEPLPAPGQCVCHDFRDNSLTARHITAAKERGSLRMITFNIERGYQLDRIIQQLKQVDADVLSLQEIDIHCERSQWKDIGVEIAKALKLNYMFGRLELLLLPLDLFFLLLFLFFLRPPLMPFFSLLRAYSTLYSRGVRGAVFASAQAPRPRRRCARQRYHD